VLLQSFLCPLGFFHLCSLCKSSCYVSYYLAIIMFSSQYSWWKKRIKFFNINHDNFHHAKYRL
jgi:hypothetical protein